jgi:hypothetical protein
MDKCRDEHLAITSRTHYCVLAVAAVKRNLNMVLMTLAYQFFTAVLLLIYGSLFLRGIYYCLDVFWCAIVRMSELELNFLLNVARVEAKSDVTASLQG